MTNSPLGQYAPLVATAAAVGLIGAYIVALLFKHVLQVDDASLTQLQGVAFVAIGAVFGSAVSVNGWKQPLSALHARLDTNAAKLDALAGAVATAHPGDAPAIAAVISDGPALAPADG